MFIRDWPDVWRLIVVAVVTYPLLITVLRISGKRTLAKMNAFDFVVTVALGSTLATILWSRDVSATEGSDRVDHAGWPSVRDHLAIRTVHLAAWRGQI